MKLHLQTRSKPQIAQPRMEIPTEHYVPKPIVTRAGSQDFLKHPSRSGDTFTPHRAPISLAGAM